ncbi:hypothetical protein [Amycolatopsis thermoflava]|uniref:hypothetical protein n=1 Tax=Amycolatopsis thermoflava TaxID=84480 RepID=UPI001E5C1B27|nr:hypothetical protein [Amycolatopsis thermoflava]
MPEIRRRGGWRLVPPALGGHQLVVLDGLFVSLLLAEPGRSAEAQALVADVLSEHRY